MPAILIDYAKAILFNKYTICAAVAAVAFMVGHYIGGLHRDITQQSQAIQDSNEASERQHEIDAGHEARVVRILSRPVVDVDASRMLSSWPDEAAPVGEAEASEGDGKELPDR